MKTPPGVINDLYNVSLSQLKDVIKIFVTYVFETSVEVTFVRIKSLQVSQKLENNKEHLMLKKKKIDHC